MNQNRLTAQDYIEIILRRKWWLIFALFLGTILAALYSYSLPPVYRSSTLILVEPQKIPTAYVSPTVTSTLQERLGTISQQILSRTNLERIILQFGLYGQERRNAAGVFDRLVQRLKSLTNLDVEKIFTQFDLPKTAEPVPLETLVERVRKNIEVTVIGGGNAFSVSYEGRDPLTAMKVTNTLASLFIEENLKIREQQAEGTSEFLESQLAEAKRQLEKQEQALKEFKEIHMGALPGQMDANLRTLDRLQLELQTVNDALRTAEERKSALTRFKLEMKNIDEALKSIADVTGTPLGAGTDPTTPHVARLKEELTRLQTQFTDNYPDIVLLKKQISEAEAQMGKAGAPQTPAPAPSPASRQGDGIGAQPLNLYSTELLTLNSEVESLKRRRERVAAQIKEYEMRVETTFNNEQTLLNLTRDYETSQRNYQALLDKRLNAKISENLEKRQKGEQFRILDPANLPQKPYKPDRRKIILLGSLLSAAMGVGGILLQEFLRPSFRKPEDFNGTIDLPVLAAIPSNKLVQSKNHGLTTLQEPYSFMVEQYRLLYTKISQLTTGKPHTVFAISSAIQEEGKTVTALNLALVMARDFGKKTLVIEGDLKNPKISGYLQPRPQTDLVDILFKKSDVQSGLLTFGHDNLSVLPMLKSIKNSSGILSSQEMVNLLSTLKEHYDFIIVDSPPILSLPDMNILEQLVDGIILVVRAEKTPRAAVLEAINSLLTEKLVGIVLNDVNQPLAWYRRYSYGKA